MKLITLKISFVVKSFCTFSYVFRTMNIYFETTRKEIFLDLNKNFLQVLCKVIFCKDSFILKTEKIHTHTCTQEIRNLMQAKLNMQNRVKKSVSAAVCTCFNYLESLYLVNREHATSLLVTNRERILPNKGDSFQNVRHPTGTLHFGVAPFLLHNEILCK